MRHDEPFDPTLLRKARNDCLQPGFLVLLWLLLSNMGDDKGYVYAAKSDELKTLPDLAEAIQIKTQRLLEHLLELKDAKLLDDDAWPVAVKVLAVPEETRKEMLD